MIPPIITALFGILAVIFAFGYFFMKKKNQEIGVKMNNFEIEKNNYEILTQKANDIILVIDIVNGKILQTNDKAASMFGYNPQLFLTKTIFDLHPKELLLQSSETIADVWEQKGLVYQHLPFLLASGDLLQVECSAKVVEYNNSPSIVIYARDITERIRLQNKIKADTQIIETKNKHILSSINYALLIQKAILPTKRLIEQAIPESFIFYLPKDIVSGDFYWIEEKNDSLYLAAVDCTGHGVPGGFLTMLGNSSLDRALYEYNLKEPAVILDKLNELIQMFLHNEENTLRDGMDISMCRIDKQNKILAFAGANNPLYIVRRKEFEVIENEKVTSNNEFNLIEIKPDKIPIGKTTEIKKFTTKSFKYYPKDRIFLFSDGFIDQFGGPSNRKFMSKRFKELLLKTSWLSIVEQQGVIETEFFSWKGNTEQIDDICLIGVELD